MTRILVLAELKILTLGEAREEGAGESGIGP